jgi:hypothetical protein
MTNNSLGLMELNHRELLAYAVGQKNLSPVALELVLRFEQILDARDMFLDNLANAPCQSCRHLASLLPPDQVAGEVVIAIEGDTQWQ